MAGRIPEGDRALKFEQWITDAATSGRIAGKPVSEESALLASEILPLLTNNSGFKISHNLMQVEIPTKGNTAQISASLRPWQ